MIITEISTNKYTESINSWFVTKNHKDVLFFIQKNIDMKLSKMYFSNGKDLRLLVSLIFARAD